MEIVIGAPLMFWWGWRFASSKKQADAELAKEKLQEAHREVEKKESELIEIRVSLTRQRVFLGGSLLSLAAIAYFLRVAWIRQKEAEARAEMIENTERAWDCLSCMENPKEIVYLPCCHLCFCHECDEAQMGDADEQQVCPICREMVVDRKKVYTL